MVSAILDNATLTAAEIGPTLTESQIKSALLGLLISGGMLIPGNIPNIIAAHALEITSTEWARLGVPLGFVLMVVYRASADVGAGIELRFYISIAVFCSSINRWLRIEQQA